MFIRLGVKKHHIEGLLRALFGSDLLHLFQIPCLFRRVSQFHCETNFRFPQMSVLSTLFCGDCPLPEKVSLFCIARGNLEDAAPKDTEHNEQCPSSFWLQKQVGAVHSEANELRVPSQLYGARSAWFPVADCRLLSPARLGSARLGWKSLPAKQTKEWTALPFFAFLIRASLNCSTKRRWLRKAPRRTHKREGRSPASYLQATCLRYRWRCEGRRRRGARSLLVCNLRATFPAPSSPSGPCRCSEPSRANTANESRSTRWR